MNLIPLMILFLAAFLLQYLFTFMQMKNFNKHYSFLRKKGRVAIGKVKGVLRAGAIVMFAIDEQGMILAGSYLQGVTVLARCRKLQGFEGKNVARLTENDCKTLRLSHSLTRGVLEASSNYNILMAGGEIPEQPSPIKRMINGMKRQKAAEIK
ncbi:MAG: transcriptional regulator GutM [Eubacteriales bacterium]|nr:transcriptional regulator GutM [Eubacteriales bacterium]